MRRFVELRVSSFLNRLRTGSLVAMDWDLLSPRRHKTKSVLMISLSDHGRRQSVGFPGLTPVSRATGPRQFPLRPCKVILNAGSSTFVDDRDEHQFES